MLFDDFGISMGALPTFEMASKLFKFSEVFFYGKVKNSIFSDQT